MPTTSLFGPIALLAHFRGQIDLTRYLVRSDGLVRGWFQRVHFSSANRGGGGGRHHRGRICVVGRAGLQAHACECYGTVKRESDRLMELSRLEATMATARPAVGRNHSERPKLGIAHASPTAPATLRLL